MRFWKNMMTCDMTALPRSVATTHMAACLALSAVAIGLAALMTVSVGCHTARPSAVTVYESAYSDADTTCAALKTAIERQGLVCQAVRNMTQAMQKHGVHHDRQVRIVEFCKADYAHNMLDSEPELCTLMPCVFGVYEHDDGKIYISVKNQTAMGTLFSGKARRLIEGPIAQDQETILKIAGAHRRLTAP